MGYAVKQPKNGGPQNQDLIPPKSFLEGVQNPSFEYKNKFYCYIIIIIVLYSQLYQKIITRCSLLFQPKLFSLMNAREGL